MEGLLSPKQAVPFLDDAVRNVPDADVALLRSKAVITDETTLRKILV